MFKVCFKLYLKDSILTVRPFYVVETELGVYTIIEKVIYIILL